MSKNRTLNDPPKFLTTRCSDEIWSALINIWSIRKDLKGNISQTLLYAVCELERELCQGVLATNTQTEAKSSNIENPKTEAKNTKPKPKNTKPKPIKTSEEEVAEEFDKALGL
jgi:hypothetical protein